MRIDSQREHIGWRLVERSKSPPKALEEWVELSSMAMEIFFVETCLSPGIAALLNFHFASLLLRRLQLDDDQAPCPRFNAQDVELG